ncbi:MAG TPA: NAD(P)-dependent oxidoreductase [Gemmatimonadaceae bacterium]|nr:NAD(P)-dependent oxidoreductase [Gemmatimonadaceae bacterium]
MQPTILSPDDSRALVPELSRTLNPAVWVYRFRHPKFRWTLSIATHAEPGSDKLSLGGFRIAPKERTESPGFNPDKEAIGLAMGMEEKVYWSRLIGVGGPLARRDMNRIVGGKCVLDPTDDARVGHPNDFALLDWAIHCFRTFEQDAGVRITTGQDLGHGLMSDGKTQSLDYLSERFPGSVDADTSKPTAEGNFYVLEGMLRAVGIPLAEATVGLIGLGNIGMHVFERLNAAGATILAVETREDRRAPVERAGHRVWDADGKPHLLAQPMDALVVNAAGGSLDSATVDRCIANEQLRVVCGSENLVMPHAADADRLRAAHESYCPTELGGMMGYLTAVEEYLAHLEGEPFDVQALFEAAKRLEPAAYEATARQIAEDYAVSFEDAVRLAARV